MSEDNKREIYISGNKVVYEEEAKRGIFYLENDLKNEYADVYFYYAKNRKPAPFEDDDDRKYILKYTGSDTYELKKK